MTLIRKVKAMVTTNGYVNLHEKALVHFTSDNMGETLSVEAKGVQITMRYKDIEAIVKRERSFHYKNGHAIIDESEDKEQEEDGNSN